MNWLADLSALQAYALLVGLPLLGVALAASVALPWVLHYRKAYGILIHNAEPMAELIGREREALQMPAKLRLSLDEIAVWLGRVASAANVAYESVVHPVTVRSQMPVQQIVLPGSPLLTLWPGSAGLPTIIPTLMPVGSGPTLEASFSSRDGHSVVMVLCFLATESADGRGEQYLEFILLSSVTGSVDGANAVLADPVRAVGTEHHPLVAEVILQQTGLNNLREHIYRLCKTMARPAA